MKMLCPIVALVVISLLGLLIYFAHSKRNPLKRVFKIFKPTNENFVEGNQVVGILSSNLLPSEKGILATSLYGPPNENVKKRYVKPLMKNAENLPTVMPGWKIRVYMSPSIYEDKEIVYELLKNNCEIYLMSRNPIGHEASIWRFYAARSGPQEVLGMTRPQPFFSFDSDDILCPILSDRLSEWLKSGKQFVRCIIPITNLFIPITASRWGCLPGAVPNMEELVNKYSMDSGFGIDEVLLHREVWPLMKSKGCYQKYISPEEL